MSVPQNDAAGTSRAAGSDCATAAGRGAGALRKVALVLGSTLIALLIAEGAARVFGLGLKFGRLMPIHEVPTRVVDGVLLWGDPYPRYTDEDFRRAANDRDAFTIIGLGDSIQYGVGYEKEQTYLEQARHALDGRAGKRIDILNMAVAGYNTVQEDAVYKEVADRIKPDLVLVHYWGDDWHQYRFVGGYVVDIGDISADGRLVVRALPLPARLSDFLLVHSRLYDQLTRFVLDHAPKPDPEYSTSVYAPLAAIQKRAREAGGRLVVLASPRLDSARPKSLDELAQLQEFAATQGIEVVDLTPWLGEVESKQVAMDGYHFNAEGHRLIGQRLAEYLLEHDLKARN